MTAIDSTARRPGRVPLASFGAALATLTIAPSVEASIISVGFSRSRVPFGGTGPSGGAGIHLSTGGTVPVFFYQFNNTGGKTLDILPGITGFVQAAASSTLNSGFTFKAPIIAYTNSNVAPSATGTAYFGFLTTAGQLGWLKMNLGGTGGAITYLAAAINTVAGDPIHVGAVPEPSTASLLGFGVLALGAAGVLAERRRRKGLSAVA
jgi:hypothetical protein